MPRAAVVIMAMPPAKITSSRGSERENPLRASCTTASANISTCTPHQPVMPRAKSKAIAAEPLAPKVRREIRAVEHLVTAPRWAVQAPRTPRISAPQKVAGIRSEKLIPRPSCPPSTNVGMLIITPISIMSRYHQGLR